MFWNKKHKEVKDTYADEKADIETSIYTNTHIDKYLEIGKRLKQARVNKGMTLQEVGKIIGKTDATIQRYESGKIKTISINTLEKLANLYDVSPIWILDLDKYVYKERNNLINNEKK